MWKIEHRVYRLPFRQTVRTAHGPWAQREGIVLRVARVDEAGKQTGAPSWGEVAPIPWFGTETLNEAEAALVALEGRAESLAYALARVPVRCACVRAGLAAALGAAAAEVGAEGAEAQVKFLPVAGLLPAGRPAFAAVAAKLELGFRIFKWKVGVGAAADEWAMLDDLLGRLPEGATLRLDANGAWDARTAARWMERAAERPIEFIEQPIAADAAGAEDVLRGLAADYPTPIALDEALSGPGDVARWLAAEWRGVWVLKPALLGEPAPVLHALAKARADVVFGSALETRIGAQAALRLAFAWAEARHPEAGKNPKPRALGFGVWPLFEDARADGPQTGAFVRREEVERMNAEDLWNALN